MPVGRADYKERKEEKISSFTGRAAKAKKLATQQTKKAGDIGSAIPFGQPILVGHHSEKKHRAAVKKIETAHRKSAEALDKADYYEARVQTIENNSSISSDDPESVIKYKEKLAKLETLQERMKSVNSYWRKNKTMKGFPGLSESEAVKIDEQMKTAYSWIQKGGPHADFLLKNNNAEIRRIRVKLETLAELNGMEAETIKFKIGVLRVNVDANRVQFIFDGKPSEKVRSILKRSGFRWAPSEGAWQRQRTKIAVRIAKNLIPEMENI